MIDFVILGAQKAATSALQAALRQHPDIHMPKGESAFFEDPDYDARPWEDFGSDHPETRLSGIKRPDNLCSAQAIDRIAAALPAARFIVVLREPVSRAVSSYVYLVRHAHLPARALNPGLSDCIDAYESGRDDRASSIVRYGLYGSYLARWFAKFPKDRFLILSQEDVRTDAAGALRSCASHLGVTSAPLIEAMGRGGIADSNRGLYDPALLPLARFGSLLKTRIIPGTTRREPRGVTSRVVGKAVTRSVEALDLLRGGRREQLSREIEARLRAHYDADLTLLRAIVPQDVIYWDRS